MLIARSAAALAALLPRLPQRAFVPTMGALHEGHLDLVRAAHAAGPVVASIFVNPLQFAPGEDLARYPRDEPGDLAALRGAGCQLAFLPDAAEIYPPGDATIIEVAGPALNWEGARRPTHFRGVATVVARLFGLVQPATAWFGEKDWQQLQVIRRMVTDLRMPVAIHGVPTRRAEDGLALSSRNRYLSDSERAIAPCLAQAGQTALAALRAGAPLAPTLAQAQATLSGQGFEVDYLAAVDADSLVPLTTLTDPARLIAAARLGPVRLLDNWPI